MVPILADPPASAKARRVPDADPDPKSIPPLEAGDRLCRDEFERRYHAMADLKKAELIEGIVYMPSPVRISHAQPHGDVATWLGFYASQTNGTQRLSDATSRLDGDNEPQPDAMLRILPERGGQSRDSADGYVEGAPELAVEIAASSVAYDLHVKKNAYRRNGVCEYLVLLVREAQVIWWSLEGGEYAAIEPEDGVLKSRRFPGLWLDPEALVSGDIQRLIEVLQCGLATGDHRAFVEALGAGSESE
ncbi:MAG: Uma2 family endonuclease [Verrucomicrobiales bacterium]